MPCADLMPRTCGCERECVSLHMSFRGPSAPKCVATAAEVVSQLARCTDHCNFHGW
jgi:hypothetical protein